MKRDGDTYLFPIGIGEQDMAQASGEEGSSLQDEFVVLEGPQMAKLSLKVANISDALDLVPVSKRAYVEHAVGHAVRQGLDSWMECCQVFDNKYANSKYHQPWLCALKQAISEGDPAEQEDPEEHLLQGAPKSRNLPSQAICKIGLTRQQNAQQT